MNILADLGSDMGLLGGAVTLCAVIGCCLCLGFAINAFVNYKENTPKFALGCLILFFGFSLYFPIVDMCNWNAQQEWDATPISDREGGGPENTSSITNIIVGFLLVLAMSMVGGWVANCETKGVHLVLVIIFGLIAGLVYFCWIAETYKNP